MSQEHMFFRPDVPLDPIRVLADLRSSAASGQADAIDRAVLAAFHVGLRPEFAGPFIELLDVAGHHSHEDIVSGLQKLRDPRAVDVLYRAAQVQHEYLGFDEFFGLARKCTWALADIGTREAKSKLMVLAQSQNDAIRGYAQKRLDRWESEAGRKAAQPGATDNPDNAQRLREGH